MSEMNCPYCKYLYDKIYVENGGETVFENSVFDCSGILQNYSENNDAAAYFLKVTEKICNIHQNLFEKYSRLIQQWCFEKGVATSRKYQNRNHLRIITESIYKGIIKRKKLFEKVNFSEKLKNHYDVTMNLLKELPNAEEKSGWEKISTILFNYIIVINSLTYKPNKKNDSIDLSFSLNDIKEIERKITPGNISKLTRSVVSSVGNIVGDKKNKFINTSNEKVQKEKIYSYAEKIKNVDQELQVVAESAYEIASECIEARNNALDEYFMQLIRATYTATKQSNILEE